MANPEHVSIVRQGKQAILEWNVDNPAMCFDLERADLAHLDLERANFHDANLAFANLSGCNLVECRLQNCNLKEADLDGAKVRFADLSNATLDNSRLSDADFTGSTLRNARLCHTRLFETNLSNAVLDGCDFEGAYLGMTLLGDVDLSSAKHLERVMSWGPSILSVGTLVISGGKIPESFLRGCGVPDALIAYLPSLLGSQNAIQFYSCFISYSHKDEEFCKRVHSRMRDEHLRVWYAPEDMPGGKKLHEEIEHAIRLHDKLLLVLSEQSMESEWVKTEIAHARRREKREGKQVLFPIRLVSYDRIKEWKAFDADTGTDMAREIREYYIPDFSNWKEHDAFEQAFVRLLKDLKASVAKKAD
jgi:hypothetical protein